MCLFCRYSLECCGAWKTNTSPISLVSIKCTQALSCTNVAVSQAWGRVERFDRHRGQRPYRISDLQSNQVAGYSTLSNKLRYQSKGLTHLCQNRLVHGEKKNPRGPLCKIHELTWKWQGLLCALIFPHQQWLHFQLCLKIQIVRGTWFLKHLVFIFLLASFNSPVHTWVYISIEICQQIVFINNARRWTLLLPLSFFLYVFCSILETWFWLRVTSAWLSKDNENTFVLFTAGIDLMEYTKTLGPVIALSLLLLFLIFPIVFHEAYSLCWPLKNNLFIVDYVIWNGTAHYVHCTVIEDPAVVAPSNQHVNHIPLF